MSSSTKPGDLVYIPSEVILYQKSGDSIIQAHRKIHRPINALVTAVKFTTYEIYFEDEYWLVDKVNTYN